MDDVHAEVAREHVHHRFRFAETQQAVVNKNAGELVADGAVDQGGGNRGIHAAGQAKDDFVAADLGADIGNGFVDVVRHRPAGARTADVEDEAIQQRPPLFGVGHFGVELDAVEAFGGVFHHRNRAGRRIADDDEAIGQFAHLVAVAHPYVQRVRRAVKNAAGQLAIDCFYLRIAKLALVAGLHRAAQMMRHELHAVADAKHGHAQGKNAGIGLIVGVINGIGAAGEDDAFRIEGLNVGERHIVRVQFAIDMRLAYAAGDQLRDLRAEIEDKDFVVIGSSHKSS